MFACSLPNGCDFFCVKDGVEIWCFRIQPKMGHLYKACASTCIQSVFPGLFLCINKVSFIRALASLFFPAAFHIIYPGATSCKCTHWKDNKMFIRKRWLQNISLIIYFYKCVLQKWKHFLCWEILKEGGAKKSGRVLASVSVYQSREVPGIGWMTKLNLL